MSLDTERKKALFDWLGTVRVMSYGPPVTDVSDAKEREAIALWLDKQIGSFLEWQMMRKVNDRPVLGLRDDGDIVRTNSEKPILERTDYVNDHYTYEPVGTTLAIDPNAWPPPAKGTHESDLSLWGWPSSDAALPGENWITGRGGSHEYHAAEAWSQS